MGRSTRSIEPGLRLPVSYIRLVLYLSRLRGNSLVGQGALVFAASMFFNLCGFVFHMIAGRRLGPDVYGSLYALFSVFMLAALPAALFTPVVAKFAAEFRALHDDSHLRGLTTGLLRASLALGAAYVIVAVLGMSLFGNYLHVPSYAIVIVGCAVAVTLLSQMLRSVAQGTQRFMGFALSTSVEGVVRVGALVALAGFGLFGGLASLLAGAVMGCIVIGFILWRRYGAAPERPVAYDWKRIGAAIGGSAAATCAVTLIGNVDVIIVKHNFPAFEAGIYSAAALGGKILLYLVGFIPTVLVPQAADRHARGERTRHTIVTALVMFVVLAGVGLLVLRFEGLRVLDVLLGPQYGAAAPLLTLYGLAMVFLALTASLSSYGIATHRLAFAVPLVVCTLGTLGTIAVLHGTLATVVMVLIVGTALAAISTGAALAIQGYRSRAEIAPAA